LTTANDEPLRILRFWRDLEIFNIPTAPSARDVTTDVTVTTLRKADVRNGMLPWKMAKHAPSDDIGFIHVVFVGVADTEDLSRLVLQNLFSGQDLSEQERQRVTGNGWLASFVIDEKGRPKADSYMPASFAHGVAALHDAQTLDNLNARLARAKEEFAQRCHPLQPCPPGQGAADGEGAPPAPMLDWTELDDETRIARSLLGPSADRADLDWRVVVRTRRVKRRYLDEQLQSANDFMNSFYLDDLDRLIARAEQHRPFGQALRAYLGPALPTENRTDILADDAAMTRLVAAARLPAARWPAPPNQPLALAQQAAVAEVVGTLGQADGLLGVNGPPGTGKTTLLCDVIADIVTERAGRIAALGGPRDLFDDKVSVAGYNFHRLRADIVDGTSIVVTSTNNNAVKNITQDLPATTKIAAEFRPADYFADVMCEVFRAQKVRDEDDNPVDAWGTIAAALGNAGNRRTFAYNFFQNKAAPPERSTQAQGRLRLDVDDAKDDAASGPPLPPSMKQILEAADKDYVGYQRAWYPARQAFLTLRAEWVRCRAVLERAEAAAGRLDAAQPRLAAFASEEQALGNDIAVRTPDLAQRHQALVDLRAIVAAGQHVIAQLHAATPPTLWDRLMRLLGRETRRMATLRGALAAPTQALAGAAAELNVAVKTTAVADAELRLQRERLKAVSSQRVHLERELEPYRRALGEARAMGVAHFADAAFWRLPAAQRQRASIAVGPAIDTLRARLFLSAVELHRATILANAGKFIANLRAVNGMLTGASRARLMPEDRPLLWDAFFFVVPVVSTTLASFDRLFDGMDQDSLGWLLIDEAGQATPQSAVGAIWRSRRAVIVGDPLQIEPVFTVPRSLAEDLRRRRDVAKAWSPLDESVQTLADRVTPFGSWVSTGAGVGSSPDEPPQRLWTGMPLRTHRRCDDPMFSVANLIAYDEQMVQGRVDAGGQPTPWAFDCALGASAWFDVRSERVAHPVSDDEIACLIECLGRLRDAPGSKAKVYVISPFRKVAQACRARVKSAGFGGIDSGTVHTFQGKEAEIVFLVLGTAPGQAGAGARSWAAGKPNLLNVAITRAKCRLYVIGDASQWGGLDYFRELLDALPLQAVDAAAAV
jgi:hypothetical protein